MRHHTARVHRTTSCSRWTLDRVNLEMKRTKGTVVALILRDTTRLREFLINDRTER